MKPILFNTEMVRAILDGRKTVTRRILKFKHRTVGWCPIPTDAKYYGVVGNWHVFDRDCNLYHVKPPHKPGDILYVRETWQYAYDADGNENIDWESGRYLFAADNPAPFNLWIMPDGTYRDSMPWRPSIHMPKEAARIFLRVKEVRVERLQDITVEQVAAEGVDDTVSNDGAADLLKEPLAMFAGLWNSTIKPADIPTYGWDANPWVWVIEFERISKEEAMKEENQ